MAKLKSQSKLDQHWCNAH